MKKSEGLSESGKTTIKPTDGSRKVETVWKQLFLKKNGLFNTTQNNYLRSSSKKANLKEFKRKRERSKRGCSSEKEHKVNALAPRAEEGRDYLRKAAVSWK